MKELVLAMDECSVVQESLQRKLEMKYRTRAYHG